MAEVTSDQLIKEFSRMLGRSIDQIYEASTAKVAA